MTNTFISAIGLLMLGMLFSMIHRDMTTKPTCSVIIPDRKPLQGDEIVEWLDTWGAFSMDLEELQRFDVEGI